MRAPRKASQVLVVPILLALAGHWLFGWIAVIPAAALAGALVPARSWLAGGLAVSIAWIGLIAFNYAVAPGPTLEMTRVVSALAGGLPAFVTPIASIIVGFVLGAAGGSLGAAIRNIPR